MVDVKLYQGDCLDVMRRLSDGCVDVIITDPPYNAINRNSGGLRLIDKGKADDLPINIDELAIEFLRLATGSIYVWCSDEQYTNWVMAFKDRGCTTRICAWWKSNPSPMNGEYLWLSALELCVFARKRNAPFYRFCKPPLWHGPSESFPGHPTPKPLWLMSELVTASTPKRGTVFDPFMGSGTTGVACVQTGRNFIGCEIDPSYFAIAQKRINDAREQTTIDFDDAEPLPQVVQATIW
jgi:site-specific DNA-methyltransferase (adenine-specific)